MKKDLGIKVNSIYTITDERTSANKEYIIGVNVEYIGVKPLIYTYSRWDEKEGYTDKWDIFHKDETDIMSIDDLYIMFDKYYEPYNEEYIKYQGDNIRFISYFKQDEIKDPNKIYGIMCQVRGNYQNHNVGCICYDVVNKKEVYKIEGSCQRYFGNGKDIALFMPLECL